MARAIRSRDRELNHYPHLHYPELYVLLDGYKNFFAGRQNRVRIYFFVRVKSLSGIPEKANVNARVGMRDDVSVCVRIRDDVRRLRHSAWKLATLLNLRLVRKTCLLNRFHICFKLKATERESSNIAVIILSSFFKVFQESHPRPFGSLESVKVIIGSLESENIGSLHVHTGYLIFSLKKTVLSIL